LRFFLNLSDIRLGVCLMAGSVEWLLPDSIC